MSTNEDSIVSGSILADNGARPDSDPDVIDILMVTAVNGASGNLGSQIKLTTGALLTLNANGTFDYDPNGAFETLAIRESATDSFTYTIGDGNDGRLRPEAS